MDLCRIWLTARGGIRVAARSQATLRLRPAAVFDLNGSRVRQCQIESGDLSHSAGLLRLANELHASKGHAASVRNGRGLARTKQRPFSTQEEGRFRPRHRYPRTAEMTIEGTLPGEGFISKSLSLRKTAL